MNRRDRFWEVICAHSAFAYYLLAVSFVLLALTLFSIRFSASDGIAVINRINAVFLTVNVLVSVGIIYRCRGVYH